MKGSLSADTLITSFDTETAPFRASILESGQASYGSAEAFLGVAGTAFEDLASQLNCAADQSDLECVRQADAFEIRQVVNDNPLNFVPFTDNITSFGNGAVRRQAGNFARVPILSGTNSEEGKLSFCFDKLYYPEHMLTKPMQAVSSSAIRQASPPSWNNSSPQHPIRSL